MYISTNVTFAEGRYPCYDFHRSQHIAMTWGEARGTTVKMNLNMALEDMQEKASSILQLAIDESTGDFDVFSHGPVLQDPDVVEIERVRREARELENYLPADYDIIAPGIIAPRMGMPHPLFDPNFQYQLP
eukprot:888864-Rhodomonas_salina.1